MEEFPYHLAVIFIGQDGEQEDPLPRGKDIFIGLAEGIDTGRIMGPVEDDVDISGLEDLETAWPLDVTDAVFQDRPGQFLFMAGQDEQGHERSGTIRPLVFSQKRQDRRNGKAVLFADRHHLPRCRVFRPGIADDVETVVQGVEAAVLFIGLAGDDLQSGPISRRDNGDTFFDDARLLFGNGFDRIATVFHVIHGDVGNDRYDGDDDVRRIEEAAQADFDDGVIDTDVVEIPESGSRNHFKFRRPFPAGSDHGRHGVFDDGYGFGEVVAGNIVMVDMDPFRVIFQMRRRIAARPEAGFRQDRCDHGRHRAFTVGPGDVNGLIVILGIAQAFQ